MVNTDISPTPRVAAARTVLGAAIDVVEHEDLVTRVATLETALTQH